MMTSGLQITMILVLWMLSHVSSVVACINSYRIRALPSNNTTSLLGHGSKNDVYITVS